MLGAFRINFTDSVTNNCHARPDRNGGGCSGVHTFSLFSCFAFWKALLCFFPSTSELPFRDRSFVTHGQSVVDRNKTKRTVLIKERDSVFVLIHPLPDPASGRERGGRWKSMMENRESLLTEERKKSLNSPPAVFRLFFLTSSVYPLSPHLSVG